VHVLDPSPHRDVHHPAAAERLDPAEDSASEVHPRVHATRSCSAYYIAAINIEATFHGMAGGVRALRRHRADRTFQIAGAVTRWTR
jgi:hypothetical protein